VEAVNLRDVVWGATAAGAFRFDENGGAPPLVTVLGATDLSVSGNVLSVVAGTPPARTKWFGTAAGLVSYAGE
jgi:hypothetical protein